MPLSHRIGFPVRLLAFVISVLTVCMTAQPVDVHPVRSGSATVSLNGTWQFAYVPVEQPGRPSLDASIMVPGHWELQDFAEPVYGTKELPAGMGFYRRSFRVPKDWNGQRIFLLFEGVLSGFAAVMPGSASEFQWLGSGPYAGYPGKDILNEFGRFHLHRADLHFQGNRRAVEIALLTDPVSTGLALGGEAMDISVERVGEDTALNHNALISGRGTKFVEPDDMIKVENDPRISGRFVLLPLNTEWPALLNAWVGNPFK